MGRLDFLRKPQPEEEPQFNLVEVSGSFECQFCDECVDIALYSPDTSELGWKCPNGHMSVAKGVEL